MKYFIVFLLVLSAASSQAQITLEHTYPLQFYPSYRAYDVVFSLEVDNAQSKYVIYNQRDTIKIFNINHTLEKTIVVPAKYAQLSYIRYMTKNLFSLDNLYEYVFSNQGGNVPIVKILNENGDLLFSCDSCNTPDIFNTENGTKCIVPYLTADRKNEVYSLPGKLPGKAKSGVNSPTIISGSSLPTSAYPNPSNGQVRIEYKLPEGVATGELIITNAEGIEVKKYQVGNIFNDILIEKSDLQSGSYFYKLVTEKGESEARKLILLK